MSHHVEGLEQEYVHALERHLAGSAEETLHAAYEIGRKALDEGLGILDMAVIVHGALRSVSGSVPRDLSRPLWGLESFVLESFAPFEMAHRGASEVGAALRRQNEILEAEIARIAHELHDSAGQLLACAYMSLARLESEVPQAGERISEVRAHLDQVEGQVRRLSHELRPLILDDLGLVPAVRALGEGVFLRTGIRVSVRGSVGDLPAAHEVALYRVVQEALANAVRHAEPSLVWVELRVEAGSVHCVVRDDGVGMPRRNASDVTPTRGLGLTGIRERVAPFGGTMEIASNPDHGTQIRVSIPLESHHVASHRPRR